MKQGNLVLSFRRHETFVIDFEGQRVEVSVIDLRKSKLKLAFKAPIAIRILRSKLLGLPPRSHTTTTEAVEGAA